MIPEKQKGRENPTFHNTLLHSCQYIRGQPRKRFSPARIIAPDSVLSSLQVVCRHLAGLAVLDELEADLLAVVEATHTSALNSRDVDENVLAAVVRLNEAEALCGIKPFYCASGHNDPFL